MAPSHRAPRPISRSPDLPRVANRWVRQDRRRNLRTLSGPGSTSAIRAGHFQRIGRLRRLCPERLRIGRVPMRGLCGLGLRLMCVANEYTRSRSAPAPNCEQRPACDAVGRSDNTSTSVVLGRFPSPLLSTRAFLVKHAAKRDAARAAKLRPSLNGTANQLQGSRGIVWRGPSRVVQSGVFGPAWPLC